MEAEILAELCLWGLFAKLIGPLEGYGHLGPPVKDVECSANLDRRKPSVTNFDSSACPGPPPARALQRVCLVTCCLELLSVGVEWKIRSQDDERSINVNTDFGVKLPVTCLFRSQVRVTNIEADRQASLK